MLIPVQYHNKIYPDQITPKIIEIAGHFDILQIRPGMGFSLHTEYSYGPRKFGTRLVSDFPTIISAQKNGVPMLWHSAKWAEEFARFIIKLCDGRVPEVIEIHPPFSDYTAGINQFLERYSVFEGIILSNYPETDIIIENRSGTIYRGGRFIVSKGRDLRELCDQIANQGLQLSIALDIPQLLTEYGGPINLSAEKLDYILHKQNSIRSFVKSIHLWGKRRSASGRWVAHNGDLNSYFKSSEKKQVFLKWFNKFLDDGRDRYFVPEVNSSVDDLCSIVNDLKSAGISLNNN